MPVALRKELLVSTVLVGLTLWSFIVIASEPKKDLFEELTFSGCYADTNKRPALEGRKEIDASRMTRTKCFAACAKRRYNMFGLRSGTECHCGNNLMQAALTEASKCRVPCVGDKSQQCGGQTEMAVYKINDINFFDKLHTEVTAAAFYGCYRDDGKQSVLLDVVEKKNNAMSSEMCRRFCTQKQLKLYGLRAGNLCYCGSGLRDGAVTENGMCDSICLGNRAERCGGKWHTEIYQILRIGNFQLPKPVPHSDEL